MGRRARESVCVLASPGVSLALEAFGWKGPRWWHDWSVNSKPSRHRHHEHLCVARLEELTDTFLADMAHFSQGKKRYLVFVGDLPVEAVAERMVGLNVRDPSRIHICRASTSKQERLLLERLVNAIALGAHEDAIVDAWWEADSLVVLSPRFERMHVARARLFSAVPRLRRLSRKSLRQFDIHEDGAYVHWPKADVHLGWDQLHQMVDERARLDAVRERGAFQGDQGRAIRALRESRGLTQSDVEGLTARHLRRIEGGDQALTHKALLVFADAHNMTADAYLAALAERM